MEARNQGRFAVLFALMVEWYTRLVQNQLLYSM